jgi:tripartite-type tricarboxylate transporter receptor subunit TctC
MNALLRAAALVAALGLAAAGPAAAQTKNLRLVIPFPPGGSADVLARLVGQEAARITNENLIVENRPGGGTVIATDLVARAAPDGGTLLVMANSFVINPHVRSSLPYNPLTSFAPVCLLVTSPQLIVVHSNSPYKTLADYVAAAKAHPGELSIATVGPATTQHIAAELFKLLAHVDLTYVAYPGGAPAVNALLGEHVTSVLGNHSEVVEHLNSGALRALAVTSRERLDATPNVPTVVEAGYKDYEAAAWFGVVAPAGTPKEAIARLSAAFQASLQVPDVKAKLVNLGLYPTPACEDAFAAHIRRQYDQYGTTIREAKIKVE